MSNKIKFVPKGWGFEKWIVNCEEYCGKLLYFVKGKRCSWHYHVLKDEVFYIQSGKVLLKYADSDDINSAKEVELGPGDKFHIYRGLRHQMIALDFLILPKALGLEVVHSQRKNLKYLIGITMEIF